MLSEPECQRRERHLLGQGKALAKDSSGSGANWCTGIASADPLGVINPMNSRLDFDGTVTATDMDRATDAREKGRIGILGSALAYAGSSPRITSEKIGRDVNPLGRGGGMALVGGQLNLGRIAPSLPQGHAAGGTGSSVNNAGDNNGPPPIPPFLDDWCASKRVSVSEMEDDLLWACGLDEGRSKIKDPLEFQIRRDPDPGARWHDYCDELARQYTGELQDRIRFCNSQYGSAVLDSCRGLYKLIGPLRSRLQEVCKLRQRWFKQRQLCEECLKTHPPEVCKPMCDWAEALRQKVQVAVRQFDSEMAAVRLEIAKAVGAVKALHNCYMQAMDHFLDKMRDADCDAIVQIGPGPSIAEQPKSPFILDLCPGC